MVRFNDKTQIANEDISIDDIIPITDISDSSDDKKITVGQIANFTEAQDSTISGDKTFSGGAAFSKGNISYGQYTPFPTGVGPYVTSYVSPTYGARLLGYNGSAYQDLAIGSMPTAGTFSMKSLANGDCNFGYNVNIAEDLEVTGDIDATGDITANSFIGDGSSITNVGTKNITQIGTCSTASATSEKAVTLSGFVLTTGATIEVTFTNANTAKVPTLNVNSLGAIAIYNEAGTAVSATNPAYFPTGSTVEFFYNGVNWIFKKRCIENYVNGTSWYRIYSDGWIEQGGSNGNTSTTYALTASITFPKTFTVTPNVMASKYSSSSGSSTAQIYAIRINSITSSGFSITQDSNAIFWYACGY